jgi:exopolysaccharide biosynthesis polyprenyl glycosylphosphotransferase
MWTYLRNRSIHRLLLLLLVDACLLSAALYGGYVIKFSVKTLRVSMDLAASRANPFLLVAVLSHMGFLYIYGLYSLARPYTATRNFLYVVYAITASTSVLMALQFFVPGYWMGRVVLAIQYPLCIVFIYCWRLLFYRSWLSSVQRKRLALIGPEQLIRLFLRDASTALSFRYRVHGACFTDRPAPSQGEPIAGFVLYESVLQLVRDPSVDAISFQFPDRGLTAEDIHAVLHRTCEGLEVSDLITLYKGLTGKVPLLFIDERWLLAHAGILGGPNPFYLKVKRLVDVVIGTAGLLLALPFMGVISVWIRWDSPGPVLFRQERLSQYRRGFQCLKFRTMVQTAESATGPVWSSSGDPRVTRPGRWLRKARLDELPQLINVVRGDMSLIGPRPIRAHFADQLARRIALYELRFAMRPGLTGWAQVNHPYADTEDAQLEKFEYDLFYIQNASVFLDSMTLLMTLRTLFERKGQ